MVVKTLSKSLFLLMTLVVITCVMYPLSLWLVGQTFFPFQANGSILYDAENKPIGSKLIAQPFTKDDYFQPRPSAASYDASASASSALAASNYALRDRVARTVGAIAMYQNGKSVAPDVEKWFQQNKYQDQTGIVTQWATLHNSLAQAWVSADPTHAAFINAWAKIHPAVVTQFVKDNPSITSPQASDLAVVFFQSFSKENSGKFPSMVNGKIVAVNSGIDIQTIFFDMWRQAHPDELLKWIPGDLVTTSASGLDPDISLQNAEFQLDRVAATWASHLKRNPIDVRNEIEQIIQANVQAPFGGLVGEKFVNVLELNLALRKKLGGV